MQGYTRGKSSPSPTHTAELSATFGMLCTSNVTRMMRQGTNEP